MTVLKDNFDDNIQAAWWLQFISLGHPDPQATACGSVAEANQRLECTVPASCVPATGIRWHDVGYVTAHKYDLAKHYIEITVQQLQNLIGMFIGISPTLDTTQNFRYRNQLYACCRARDPTRFMVFRKGPGGEYAPVYETTSGVELTGTIRIELKADNRIYFYDNGVLRYSEPYQLSSTEVYIYLYGKGGGDQATPYTGTDYFDNFTSNIPLAPSPPEGKPSSPPTTPPSLPAVTPEPAPGPTTYIDVVQNRAGWRAVFILDDESLEPVCQDYPLWVQVKPGTACGSGQQTVESAGTPVQLIATSTPILSVTIKALDDNAGNIYVGGASVSATTGYVLGAGDAVSLDVDDLSDVYIDAANDDDGVSFIYVVP